MLAVSTALAIVAGAGVAVVSWPSVPLRLVDLAGGACAAYQPPDRTKSMSVSLPVRNDSGEDVTVLGAHPFGTVHAERVRLRVLPGHDEHPNSFGPFSSLVAGRPVEPLIGAVLPAHRTSTVIVTITRQDDAAFAAIDGVTIAQRGTFGTVRTTSLPAWLGVAAAGHIDECRGDVPEENRT